MIFDRAALHRQSQVLKSGRAVLLPRFSRGGYDGYVKAVREQFDKVVVYATAIHSVARSREDYPRGGKAFVADRLSK